MTTAICCNYSAISAIPSEKVIRLNESARVANRPSYLIIDQTSSFITNDYFILSSIDFGGYP